MNQYFEGFSDVAEIGRGGFGVVYRAYQSEFDRVVAIKVLMAGAVDEEARGRFRREASAMGRLSGHPHIVDVHAAGFTPEGNPYLVMPFLSSGSLGDRVAAAGRVPWQEAIVIAIKIAGALEAAHRAGMVHRDVKPDNILFTSYGEPQLGDFGIARVAGAAQTRSGVITASLLYAAPEILEGKPPTVSADVYALAATILAAIAGRPPFLVNADDSMVSLIARIATQPPSSLRPHDLPDPVWRVLEHGLDKNPDHRQATAEQLVLELQAAQRALHLPVTMVPGISTVAPESSQETIPRPPAPPLPPPAPRRRPAGAYLAVAAVAVVALGGAAVMLLNRTGDSPEVSEQAPTPGGENPATEVATSEPVDSGAGDTVGGAAASQPQVGDVTANSGPERNVAVLAPLSGSDSGGTIVLDGVRLAAAELNSDPDAAFRMNVVEYDTMGEEERVAELAREIAASDAVAVIGPYYSTEVDLAAPILERADLAYVSGSATSTTLTEHAWEGFFRTVGTDGDVIAATAHVAAQTLGAQRVTVVEEYFESLDDWQADPIAQALEDQGVTVDRARVASDGSDADSTAEQLVADPPDVIVFAGYQANAALATALGRAGAGEIPLVSTDGVYNTEYREAAFQHLSATYTTYPSTQGEDNEAFRDALFDATEASAELYTQESYRAAAVVAAALRQGIEAREDVRAAVAAFDGTLAGRRVRFAPGGNLIDPTFAIYQASADAWRFVETFQPLD